MADETAILRGDVNNVVLLGSARGVEKASDAATLPRPALALLAYLLLDCRGGRASRLDAGGFLWEMTDRARQAGNLRQLLFRIRAAEVAADMRLVETTPTEIAFAPESVSIDLLRFRAATRPAGSVDVAAAATPTAATCSTVSPLMATHSAAGWRAAARRCAPIPHRRDALCRSAVGRPG